jgi:hypothetical protein
MYSLFYQQYKCKWKSNPTWTDLGANPGLRNKKPWAGAWTVTWPICFYLQLLQLVSENIFYSLTSFWGTGNLRSNVIKVQNIYSHKIKTSFRNVVMLSFYNMTMNKVVNKNVTHPPESLDCLFPTLYARCNEHIYDIRYHRREYSSPRNISTSFLQRACFVMENLPKAYNFLFECVAFIH